jgi:hypothetical protein
MSRLSATEFRNERGDESRGISPLSIAVCIRCFSIKNIVFCPTQCI